MKDKMEAQVTDNLSLLLYFFQLPFSRFPGFKYIAPQVWGSEW